MRRLKVSLLSFLVLLSVSFAFNVSAQVRPRTTRGGGGGGRVVYADQFPGGDLGARINAADMALGSSAGEVVARGGGRISTQIVVSTGHTLRLEAGTYAPVTETIPILLKPGSSLVGAGWDNTVILESTAKGQFTVISAYHNAQRNGDPDSDLNLRDFQVRGANPGFHSAPQAVSLGNCSRCTVERVWVNRTRAIGIQLGGSSALGHWAEGSKVVNCLFTHVASQNLALVNGRNILFENNRFIAPGQAGGPGSTTIDLEPNEGADRLENVVIRNNFIDGKDSEMETAGNGIVVQATTGTPHVGNILVEGNTIIGGYNRPDKCTNHMSNGIYVYGPNLQGVRIVNNRITRMGQAGLNLEGTRLEVVGNHLTDVGGGGTPGMFITHVSKSRIVGNVFHYTGVGPADARVHVTGPLREVEFRNNVGFDVPKELR